MEEPKKKKQKYDRNELPLSYLVFDEDNDFLYGDQEICFHCNGPLFTDEDDNDYKHPYRIFIPYERTTHDLTTACACCGSDTHVRVCFKCKERLSDLFKSITLTMRENLIISRTRQDLHFNFQ